MKCYPTFEEAASFFGVNRAKTKRSVDVLRVPLEKASLRSLILLERYNNSVEKFLRLFPKIKELIINVNFQFEIKRKKTEGEI